MTMMLPATLQPLIKEGPLKGLPTYAEHAIACGKSIGEIRHDFIKRLAHERAEAQARIADLKALPLPPDADITTISYWTTGSPELDASVERVCL